MKPTLIALVALLMTCTQGFSQAWESIGPFGGDRHFIYQDPNNGNTLFTGGAGGFVHRSDDGGDNWRSLSDSIVLGQTKVEAFAVQYGNSDQLLTNAYNTIGMLKSSKLEQHRIF